MSNPSEILNDKQKQAVRWLSLKVGYTIDRRGLCDATNLERSEAEYLLHILDSRNCIEIIPVDDGIYASGFTVGRPILEFARLMDSPPPRDTYSIWESWWRASPLSVIVAGIVGLATLLGALTFIATFIKQLL